MTFAGTTEPHNALIRPKNFRSSISTPDMPKIPEVHGMTSENATEALSAMSKLKNFQPTDAVHIP